MPEVVTGGLSGGTTTGAADARRGAGGNDLAQQMGELARSLEAEDVTETMLDGLVAAAVAQIPGVDEGSISVVVGRRDVTSQSPSSELPERVDALQAEVGEGPCLDAAFRERLVRVPNMALEQRWPKFARRAAQAGAAAMLSIRLWVEGDDLGALNLYSRTPDAFDEESEQIGLLFVSHAAVAMAAAHKQDHAAANLATRDLIGQAKGILMERYSIDAVKAFAVLVRTSQHNNRKLRDIALELTATGQFPPVASS